MKEELQEKLVEILTNIQSAVGKASDFAMDQIPDVAVQYMQFSMAWAIFNAFLCAALTVALVMFFIWSFRKAREERLNGPFVLGCFISAPLAAITFFGTLFDIKTIAMISIAPKVWLIKELAGMIK